MTRFLIPVSLILVSIAAILIYALINIFNLKDDLEAISNQLQIMNNSMVEITNRSNKLQHNKNNETELLAMKKGFIELKSEVETLSSRLNEIKKEQTTLSKRAETAQQNSSSSFGQIESNQASSPTVYSEAESQAILDYALIDPTKEDQIWSSDTTLEIEQLFAHSPNFKIVRDHNVICGGQICKIQTRLPKEADYLEKEMFQMNLFADLSSISSISVTNQNILDDGSTQITHYIARKGYRLPTESTSLPENNSKDAPKD